MSENLPYSRNQDQFQPLSTVNVLIRLWRGKWWIAVGTLLTGMVGVVLSLIATPVYYAQSVIVLKERESFGASPFIPQLPGSNSNLERAIIILRGQQLAEEVISRHNLLPRLYPELWDSTHKSWRLSDNAEVPSLRYAAKELRLLRMSAQLDGRKGIITVGATASDSVFAKHLVDFYLEGFRIKRRVEVMEDANADREFLEEQLHRTSDPVMREKIQNLIVKQIEKAMLASSQAFQVIEPAEIPLERFSPKRKKMVMIYLLFGAFFSCIVVLITPYAVVFRRVLVSANSERPNR